MEMFQGMDYSKMGIILNGLTLTCPATKTPTLEKSLVKMSQIGSEHAFDMLL